MTESTLANVSVSAPEEALVVAALHRLNNEYIHAERINKTEFLQRTAKGPGVTNITYDEIDVRPFGDVALVHAVTHYTRDGSPVSRRYTDVWQSRDGHWRAIAAQITEVVTT
jgi:ketosteroid isomerase-like protein